VTFATRQARVKALEALERRAKQFRGRGEIWPFRIPHEPLLLHDVLDEALREEDLRLDVRALRSRTVMRLEWQDGGAWELWTVSLPSGITIYCDDDGAETRILASARRGNPLEADGFFLELLAESHGVDFGIEMSGPAPDRIRTPIADREFLIDVFTDLFEGTVAESSIREGPEDFRASVARWLAGAWREPSRPSAGRTLRRREAQES
jgi:hypothetical protein